MKINLALTALSIGLVSSFQLNYIPSSRAKFSPQTQLYESSSSEESSNRISIEYCTGCRWMLKSFWMAQELLTTFEQDIDAVTVIPSDQKGIYAVKLNGNNLLWDRKEQGGFPSPKGLKQIVRDLVEPEKFLGHSDTEERQETFGKKEEEKGSDEIPREDAVSSISLDEAEAPLPAITITYCTGCRWLLRAAYFGQEFLTTFGDEIKSVSLVPSKPPAKGGRFSIHLNGELLFDRATEGRFPEVKEVKQMIRDKVVPEKDLGHSDVQEVQDIIQEQITDDEAAVDDEAASEQRRFFGVD